VLLSRRPRDRVDGQAASGIVAATSEDLGAARQGGRFQEALYHRLSVLTFRLPPLRARGDDIVLLAERFLTRACAEYGLGAKRLGADARRLLLDYPWPGNVRELENVMERVALLGEEAIVGADRLGLALPTGRRPRAAEAASGTEPMTADAGDAEPLLQALEQTGWNVSLAARRLGLSRNAIRYRIEKLGLRPGQTRSSPTAPPADPPAAPPAPVTSVSPPPSVEPARSVVPAPAPPPPEPRGGTPTVRWEQRRVTLLRAALVMGETPTPVPDRYAGLDLVVGKIGTFGGRLEELAATGIVAAFGLDPVEDAPRRAAHAAMAILRAAQRARAEGEAVDIRLAIHVGEVVVGQASGTAEMALESKQESWALLGALVAQAEPNSIVVSEAAVQFLEPRFDLLPGEAEIQDLDAAAVGQHQVRGLDVPVNDASGMGFGKGLGHLQHDVEHAVEVRRVLTRELREGLAGHVLHGDEALPSPVPLPLPHLVHHRDVRVDERRSRAGLVEKPVPRLVGCPHLEGDASTQGDVLGQEDLAHGALPQALGDAVVRDELADQGTARASVGRSIGGGVRRCQGSASRPDPSRSCR
jgi:class 3 adenylate cyclase